MKKYHVFLLSIVILLLIGCKKDNEPVPVIIQNPGYLISPECKAWTMFQPGTYWVYLNEKTQVSDCTYYKHGLYFNKTKYSDGFHEYNWFFVNSKVFTKFSLQGGKSGNNLTVTLASNPYYQIALTQKSLEDSITHDSVPGLCTYTLVEKIPSYSLDGNNFTNVIHTKSRYQNSDVLFYEYYWARNIGIIYFRKGDLSSDTTWSLARWSVYQ